MLGPVAHAQTLYKCMKTDGRIVYQDSVCDENDASSKILKALPPIDPRSGERCGGDYLPKIEQDPNGMISAASRKARNELGLVVDLTMNYASCAADAPGFSTRFAGAYREWRAKFADLVGQYERNPTARGVVDCKLQVEAARVRIEGDKQNKTQTCMQMIGPMIEKLNREGMPQF
jgi:hypothetical protein